jgi:hypothetical protein
MNVKRKVSLKVLFSLMNSKRPFFIIGLILTALSIFILLPLISVLSVTLKEPYEKYDYKEIKKNGTEKLAKITSIRSINNVSDNGQHPMLIAYEYTQQGKNLQDKFQTLGSEELSRLKLNTAKTITVLVYKNQSIIKDLKPYSFPIYMFFTIPVVFLCVGILFLLIAFIPAFRIFNLYKTGVIKDAHLVSMEASLQRLPITFLRQHFKVHYYYFNQLKNKIFSASTTNDLLALNDKKTGDVVRIFVSEKNDNNTCLVPRLESMKYNWDN